MNNNNYSKREVLVIEDRFEDYQAIKKLLSDDFQVIPDFEEEEFDDVVLSKIANNELRFFIGDLIKERSDFLRVIICDLALKDSKGGETMIEFIRQEVDVIGKPFFAFTIPILALTKFTDEKIIQEAIQKGAFGSAHKGDVIGEAGDKTYFLDQVKTLSNNFSKSIEHYYSIDNLRKHYDELANRLLERGEAIILGIEDLKNNFDILFKMTFESMNLDKRKKFYNLFRQDLESHLTSDQKDELNQNVWQRIEEAFLDVNKSGGFKETVDAIYDILDSADLLGVKGRIIGSTLKGIFGIVAT